MNIAKKAKDKNTSNFGDAENPEEGKNRGWGLIPSRNEMFTM